MVLVCGLGSLGQACLLRLLPFDVPLRCLDWRMPSWRDPRLGERFEPELVLGDMRLPHVLCQAGVRTARAVLLLSSESTVNFEAALQVRLLNPASEVVVRSSGQLASLGVLLEQRLPGMAVVDPLLLTSGAITEALRPGDQEACFEVDGQAFVVVEGDCEDRRLQRRLRLPEGKSKRPLLVTPLGLQHRYVLDEATRPATEGSLKVWRQRLRAPLDWWRQRSRLQQAVAASLIALLLLGIALFSRSGGGWKQGVFVTLALLKGEYVDPVNVMLAQGSGIGSADPWLIGGSLIYSLAGTLLTSALVAVILEWLLREHFGPPRPGRIKRGSRRILLVEGGELGIQVGQALERQKHAVVRVDSRPDQPRSSGPMVAFDRLELALSALLQSRVEAIGLLSPDLLANLQGALELQRRWPGARFAVLAHAVEAAEQLGQMLGGMAVISSMDLVADAVVATAFGERVEEVCRIDGVNLLLVRYTVEPGDTLWGRNISRVENGYGVTVMQLAGPRHVVPLLLPSADRILSDGDQLVVLGTLSNLRRIELNEEEPPAWCVWLQGSPPAERRFDALQCLARHLGAAPGAMAHLLDGQEHLSPAIDADIGDLLVQELRRQGVRCRLEAVEGATRQAHTP